MYRRFSKKDLILRDELAIDRTILANERTFLSYSRTTLTLVAIGMVTGKGLSGVIRKYYSKQILYIAVFLLLIANTINIGAYLES